MTKKKNPQSSSFDWLREMNQVQGLTRGAIKVGVAVWSYNFGKMEAYPNYSHIADDCGWKSVGRINEYIDELVRERLLIVTKEMKFGRFSNHYTLTLPSHHSVNPPLTTGWNDGALQGEGSVPDGVNIRDKAIEKPREQSIENVAPVAHDVEKELKEMWNLHCSSDPIFPGSDARPYAAAPPVAEPDFLVEMESLLGAPVRRTAAVPPIAVMEEDHQTNCSASHSSHDEIPNEEW